MENKAVTEQEMRELVIKLGLPKVILDLFDEQVKDEQVAELIGYNYAKPYSILALNGNEQQTYQTARYIPFLELNGSEIFAYDKEKDGFVSYYLDGDMDNLQVKTWEGLFLNEVTEWIENEWEDEDVIFLGEQLNLPHIKEILKNYLEALEDHGLSTFEEKNAWISMTMKQMNMLKS